jgi:hypothetical protein
MPPLANPFPQTTRSQVWDTLIAYLKADPVLSPRVDTWQTWDGSDDSIAEPTDEDLPFVRITPRTGQQKWLDENAQGYRFAIDFDLGIGGTDIRAAFDFWGAFESCLFNGNFLLDQLYAFQVIQKTVTAPNFTPRLFGEASGIAVKVTLEIYMRINS